VRTEITQLLIPFVGKYVVELLLRILNSQHRRSRSSSQFLQEPKELSEFYPQLAKDLQNINEMQKIFRKSLINFSNKIIWRDDSEEWNGQSLMLPWPMGRKSKDSQRLKTCLIQEEGQLSANGN